ncbi:MAG: alpha/beta hydrolase [Loktanella sp.]|nr:alpha/beta hydrolase [Loktanella sp.]
MDRIYLWENDVPLYEESLGQEKPSITPFLVQDGQEHGAMIVCPGGGYTMKCVDKEGTLIAEKLNRMGIHAFVLDYRVVPYHMPVMLLDAQRAIRYVRCFAKQFGVKADKIGIMGFSAGGHLTGMCGVKWDMGDETAEDAIERVSCRPDAIAPCYGVLNLHSVRSGGFSTSVTGMGFPDLATYHEYSPEYGVTKDTPPTFMFHTAEDPLVPVEQSIDFAQKCADYGVPVELHVFPFGPHGIGLGHEEVAPGASCWSDLLGKFLHHHGF